jgi:methionyl aminopeptidase
VRTIGRAVSAPTARRGFAVVRELSGHGIGRTIHEAPSVPNFDDRTARSRLAEGTVITIEPILAGGSGEVDLAADGWTMRTRDGALAAHWEHTLVVSSAGPILLTA